MKKFVSILSVILLIAASLLIPAGCGKEQLIKADFMHNWMQYLKDDVKLIDAVLPGSHDAGSLGLYFNMDTQGSNVAEQLNAGVRYFDLRVKYDYKGGLAMFHGAQTGKQFSEILGQLKAFIDANPTEFLVLDFQHFENDSEELLAALQIEVEELFASVMEPAAYALKKGADLSSLTMGDVRNSGARYIVAWGRTEQSVLSKDYVFLREDALDSPYIGEENSKDWEGLKSYLPNYFAVNDGTRFFVLQAQHTGGDLKTFCSENSEAMNAYVDSLATSEYLGKTNIIMRDYIVQDTEGVKAILRLNLTKNNVKDDYIELFTDNT